MTTEELAKLTAEEKRIRIAELCGYAPNLADDTTGQFGWTLNGEWCGRLPDYLNDLNAMHSAEQILTEAQTDTYEYLLQQSSGVFSSAAQRADAFLLTLG